MSEAIKHTVLVICGCAITTLVTACQATEDGNRAEPKVLAVVNERPIYELEIAGDLEKLTRGRKLSNAFAKRLRSQALDHAIDRQLVLDSLLAKERAAVDREVDVQVGRLEERLRERGETLDRFLAGQGSNQELLRRTIAWRVTWQRYLDQHLTEENLQRYFKKHRRHFDGTRVRVAHILWKVDDQDNDDAWEHAHQTANEVRQQINAGRISFEEAAITYSAAPTAERGGELGLISRHQPMSEAFSKAAFSLERDDISPPTASPAGVHLIRCLAIEPGQQDWQDVRKELTAEVSRYLFQWLADRARKNARIDIGEHAE